MFVFKAKKLDITTGDVAVGVITNKQALQMGILPGDRVVIDHKGRQIIATIDISSTLVREGELGLFQDICAEYSVKSGDSLGVQLLSRPASIEAIRERMLGHKLTEEQVKTIITDVVEERLSDIELTYFVASSFFNKDNDRELYHLAKAMAETGEQIKFPGLVTDIHSIGGLPGNRTTMLAGPILATLGFTVPKTSTRAVTSPAGVADTMGYLAEVELSSQQVKDVVKKTGGCVVWGGKLNLAPADDKFVRISYPLAMEPYPKMIVSIIAKKVAMNIKYLLIEMPIGPSAKVQDYATAKRIGNTFIRLGKRFGIKTGINYLYALEPTSHGIGPALEAREVLRVLQQKPDRSKTLERQALNLVAQAAALSGKISRKRAFNDAWHALKSGLCLKKFRQIIEAQGARLAVDVDSEELLGGAKTKEVLALHSGKITKCDNQAISELARSLGAPMHPQAGIYTWVRVGQQINKGDRLFTMYAQTEERIKIAMELLPEIQMFTIH